MRLKQYIVICNLEEPCVVAKKLYDTYCEFDAFNIRETTIATIYNRTGVECATVEHVDKVVKQKTQFMFINHKKYSYKHNKHNKINVVNDRYILKVYMLSMVNRYLKFLEDAANESN